MSLIDRATRLSNHVNEVKHWKYDWFSPLKANDDDSTQESYGFQYKKWQQVDYKDQSDSFDSSSAPEDDDTLDLNLYDKTKIGRCTRQQQQELTGSKENVRLTMDDIRGAVGGVEAIPGFSSSDGILKKDEVDKDIKID